jgi:hypothetical protein
VLEIQQVRMMIHEVAFHEEYWNDSNHSSIRSTTSFPSVSRSKMLWNSLTSCKASVNAFLAIQNEELFYMTAFTFSKLCYVFISLANFVRLDTCWTSECISQPVGRQQGLDGPLSPWQSIGTVSMEREVDFHKLVSQMRDKFMTVATEFTGPDGERDAMHNLAQRMQLLLSGYENQQKTTTSTAEQAQIDRSNHGSHAQETPSNEIGNDSMGASYFEEDIHLEWDSMSDKAWNRVLDSFMMYPVQ